MNTEPINDDDQVDYGDFEKNCGFFGGHFFSANAGVQSCLWCNAKRVAPVQNESNQNRIKANQNRRKEAKSG